MSKTRVSSAASSQYRIAERAGHRKTRSEQHYESAKQYQNPTASPTLHNLPSPHSETLLDSGKRKRQREGEDYDHTKGQEPPTKERRLEKPLDTLHVHSSTVDQIDLVDHWVRNSFEWSNYLKETTTMDDRRSNPSQKRSRSQSTSYRQSTLSGDTPKAWGRKHAAIMLEKGIYMERQPDAHLAEDDEHLCHVILGADYHLPDEWRFRGQNFLTILNQTLYKNERRVLRDLGPHLMPSPELLKAQGHPGLEHIAEGVDAQWIKCTSLCGPKSRPDVSHGLSRFLFSNQEREKLTMNNTCSSETMMFPFYICEAKCFDKSIEESELQAMHGASVAGNTVIELYQKISAAQELDRRILAFSVSHNQRLVKIFAHFALIDGNNITFHRHRLFETDLLTDAPNRHRPYQIALGIWEYFYPIHLKRIQSALARQRNLTMESFAAQLGLEEDSGSSTPSSQEDNAVVTELRRELEQQREELRVRQEESRVRQEESRVRQEESRVQLKEMEHRLDQQLAQQKEQLQQQREIIALLTNQQRISSQGQSSGTTPQGTGAGSL